MGCREVKNHFQKGKNYEVKNLNNLTMIVQTRTIQNIVYLINICFLRILNRGIRESFRIK